MKIKWFLIKCDKADGGTLSKWRPPTICVREEHRKSCWENASGKAVAERTQAVEVISDGSEDHSGSKHCAETASI